MNFLESYTEQEISGWGRSDYSISRVITPSKVKEIKEIILSDDIEKIIPRGLGRSYGSPAQISNGYVIDLKKFNGISLNSENNSVKVGAGVSFDELLKVIVPEGYFIPVSPGTRFVTIGGAIAADVHGKNHHVDGSFGNYVLEIKIIDGEGNLRVLRHNDDQNLDNFWATIGGMGLTGVIIESTFTVLPIETSLVNVFSERVENLELLMEKMIINDQRFRYNVAWVDSLSKKGRGVITSGEHANLEQYQKSKFSKTDPLYYDPKAVTSTPQLLPNGLLNNFTVGLFNQAWYRKAPKDPTFELQTLSSFFHPLDGVKNWNRIYGPKGFLQYQFVVPDTASWLVKHTLDSLKAIGAPSFLTVLKRFGSSNKGLLSFPTKGWTLAVDIPISIPGLMQVLEKLDEEVAKVGGRIYLAKDSRQSKQMFLKTYHKLKEWKAIKNKLDPNHKFTSDLAKRVGL